MGQYSFFEMDQTHIGGVLNHFQGTGANDYIICVLGGRITPTQKAIARNKANLSTRQYLGLLNWFISVSKDNAYEDVTPQHECPQNYQLPNRF